MLSIVVNYEVVKELSGSWPEAWTRSESSSHTGLNTWALFSLPFSLPENGSRIQLPKRLFIYSIIIIIILDYGQSPKDCSVCRCTAISLSGRSNAYFRLLNVRLAASLSE
jgi:hypothetical protein